MPSTKRSSWLSLPRCFCSLLSDCINNSPGAARTRTPRRVRTEKTVGFAQHTMLLVEDVEVNREIVIAFGGAYIGKE